MSTLTFNLSKRIHLSLSDAVNDSRIRADVVAQLLEADQAKQARQLLRKVLREHQANSNQKLAAEVADEITLVLLRLHAGQHELRLALRYLELANNLEKTYSPRSALIAARKAIVGTILEALPSYLNGGKGNPKLGAALKAKGLKLLKNCDLAEVDLARLMELLYCIQAMNDDQHTGHTKSAGKCLRQRPDWSTASITNMVNGVTDPLYIDWTDYEPSAPSSVQRIDIRNCTLLQELPALPAQVCSLIPNAETVQASEAAQQGDVVEVGDISDLFNDLHSD